MEKRIDPKNCDGPYPTIGHTQNDYDMVGISPCQEYVAHWIKRPCDVIKTMTIKERSKDSKDCLCQSGVCPCGDIISHRIDEPCPAIVIHR